MYKTIYTEVEVDVNLSDFDTDDLLEELESRGEWLPGDSKAIAESIWLKRRVGRTDYEAELDQLIYASLGKII